MSKIINIGFLDIRDIKEDLAAEISQIENIGVLIESEESQIFLKNCEKMNIGISIKLPKDMQTIVQSEDIKLDRDYLEGISEPVAVLVSGSITFEDNIDSSLVNEKIYSMIVAGEIIVPKRIVAVVQSKSIIDGQFLIYKNGYTLFDDTIKMSNQFLNSLKPNSKLAFNELLVMEDIDLALFEEKISNIQVLTKLVITADNESKLSQYIDEYYLIDKTVIPKGSKYMDNNIYIDATSIKKYKDNILFVDGEVEIYLKDDIKIDEYIKFLICKKIICGSRDLPKIEKILGHDDIEIEIVEGKPIRNNGKMILSGDLEHMEEEISIRNSGKLVLEKNLNYEKFNEKVVSIINNGLIIVPEEKIGIVKSKIIENRGSIKSLEENKEKLKEDEENILYANMGELKL
ncbi:hypothetical protein KQI42_04750 [Tissierella sp. MSJ-40]|uniref:Uncharacterized protein n=1 Tax=Tissierella simiarum TaxID=2841534 RepID=A0ABS6E4C8_9FIRM|nr:hypothetical protein [Tissierella simiarum]MBU5437305.1 hypothetical protein [Tissierella simiarum]